jgi:hypothetical protein
MRKHNKNKEKKLSTIEQILDTYSNDELFNFTEEDLLHLSGLNKLTFLYNRTDIIKMTDSLYLTEDILIADAVSIVEAIKLLPKVEKKVVVLFSYELLTEEEVCEVFQIDLEAFYNFLFLTSLRLRAWYRRQKYKLIKMTGIAKASFSNMGSDDRSETEIVLGIIANKRFKNKENHYLKILKIKPNIFLATTKKKIKILYEFKNENIDILDISYSVKSL